MVEVDENGGTRLGRREFEIGPPLSNQEEARGGFMRPHYQCLLHISRLRVRSRPFYSTRPEYARAAAQQHSSRIYRNKNDPENREALSSRSVACKTA